jgi:hypothetical protein
MERVGEHLRISYEEAEALKIGLGLNSPSDARATDVLRFISDMADHTRGLIVSRMRYVMDRGPTIAEIEGRLRVQGAMFLHLPFDDVIHTALQEAAATLAFFDTDIGGETFIGRELEEIGTSMLSDSYSITADLSESTEQ